jgi:hypothetical protein
VGLCCLIATVSITVGAAVPGVIIAILGKIDESKMDSNKKLELLTWGVTGAIFVICLTLTDFKVIPLWLTVGITIASLTVNGLIACFIMQCFLGPTRYLEFIQKAKAEQNEVLATQALRREDKGKRRGQAQFTYKGHLIEIADDPARKSGFEYKVKIDGQDRTTGVMLWPADPDPDDVLFGADARPVKRAKLFIDWAHGGKGP